MVDTILQSITSTFRIFAVEDIVGTIKNPLQKSYGSYDSSAGIVGLLTNLIRLAFVVAGIYALFNFIFAGYAYMTAAGDAKKLEQAWARIWQTLLGLIIVISSFVFAVLIGHLFFKDPLYLLRPQIFGPTEFK